MVGGGTSQLAAVGWDGQRETESEGGEWPGVHLQQGSGRRLTPRSDVTPQLLCV